MKADELHAKLLSDAIPLAGGEPYGVTAFGGDVTTNLLCRQTAAIIDELLTGKQFVNCIEIGAGGGRWTRWLRPRCKSLLCVDRTIASKMHIDRLNLKPVPMHITCPYGQLPTGPGSPLHHAFDFVFSYDTFVHFDKVLISTYIASVAKALIAGGHFLCHVASDADKQPNQPTDESGMWCSINDTTFNSLCHAQQLHLVKSLRATQGFGSRVCLFRKE